MIYAGAMIALGLAVVVLAIVFWKRPEEPRPRVREADAQEEHLEQRAEIKAREEHVTIAETFAVEKKKPTKSAVEAAMERDRAFPRKLRP